MALTINSKIKDLMANEEACREVDKIVPGIITHPQIGLVKNMPLSKCAKLLPDTLTPKVMDEIAAMLTRVTGTADDKTTDENDASTTESAKITYDFDEIIDRANTNSVKYDTATIVNPYLADDNIPMWIADMDFAVPEAIRDAMKARIDKKILGYSMPLDPAYYMAVMDFMKRRHNHTTTFDNIIYSSGVIAAMEVAVQKFTKEGEGVIINTPAYHPFDDSVKKFGRKAVYSPLINNDGYYTFDYDDFEKKAADKNNTLFFLCSPQNPTGRVWKEEELRKIADICIKNDVYIFSDEIHCDITRIGQKHIPLATLYPDNMRMLTATAPSKTFNIAGNQLSNLIIPDTAVAQDWRMKMYCGMPNPISIDACIAAYNDCDGWIDQMREYLDDNFRYVDAYLKKHLPKAKFRIPEGTYLCWIDLRAFNKSDLDLKKTISAKGLGIEYADEFVADGEGFVRMNVACPRSTLSRAMAMLCEALGGTTEALYKPVKKKEKLYKFGKVTTSSVLPNFTVDTLKNDDVGLTESDAEKTVYMFLRYYGCTVCQVDIHNMIKHYNEFIGENCDVKVILQSDKQLLRAELKNIEMPFDIVCDKDMKLYDAFEIAPAKNKLKMVGARTLKQIYEATALKFKHGRFEGNELQLPAVFIADRNGKVLYSHYGKNISDIPSPETLLTVIKQL